MIAYRTGWRVLGALLLPAIATAVCWWLDAWISAAAKALVYLLAVMTAAAWLPRWAGVVTSLLSVLALNFFFVPPRRTFSVHGLDYGFTLVVLLAVSLLLNGLVASLRRRREEAERREVQAWQLDALAERLVECRSAKEVAGEAVAWWHENMGRGCEIRLRDGDGDGGSNGWTRVGAAVETKDAAGATAWALDNRRALGRGCADWPNMPFCCLPLNTPGLDGVLLLPLHADEVPDALSLSHWKALAERIGQHIERERMQAAAADAHSRAQAQTARNAVLASLSHDLRTPLTGILGTAGLLREQGEQLPREQRERLLLNMENEARDLSRMADNVLQTARFSQPGWRLRMQWEAPEELIGVALERSRRRWPEAGIDARVEAGLPPVQIEAGLMLQVLLNLVDNALRHGGADAQVELSARHGTSGVCLIVTDDGTGLPPGDPQQVFAPHLAGRADSAGLGLSLCRTLVEAHGGTIRAQRRERGSRFLIELPVHAPSTEAHA